MEEPHLQRRIPQSIVVVRRVVQLRRVRRHARSPAARYKGADETKEEEEGGGVAPSERIDFELITQAVLYKSHGAQNLRVERRM
jgi:hypothetical protein